MSFVLLSEDAILRIHGSVLNKGELGGIALNKSLGGALTRVEFRLSYGLIEDIYDLAAGYAVTLATGHLFNDGNKRTAFRAMDICLRLNGDTMSFDTIEVGDIIIAVAQGQINEIELAKWLRNKAG